jgi:SAM-dependent methyltransferase
MTIVWRQGDGALKIARMSDPPPSDARVSPSTARNRDPILDVLRPRLPQSGLVLEIAAGAGEHAVHFAAAFSALQWQPTDADAEALASIAAWREHAGLDNLLPPLPLDAAHPRTWAVKRADAIVAINMIHISPWPATEGLMAGAAHALQPGGGLFLYGPFIETDVPTALSNAAFDQSLRRRDPEWGIRHLNDLTALGAEHGLSLAERIAMPANNLVLVFRKSN